LNRQGLGFHDPSNGIFRSYFFEVIHPRLKYTLRQVNMSKARAATDVVVKLIVGAGQASPSPPVGPALGSKGVKSMDFCKVRTTMQCSHLQSGQPSSASKAIGQS
jgi:hypothetical protein